MNVVEEKWIMKEKWITREIPTDIPKSDESDNSSYTGSCQTLDSFLWSKATREESSFPKILRKK